MRISILAGEGYVYEGKEKEIYLGFVGGAEIYREGRKIGYVSGSDEYSFGIEAKSYRLAKNQFWETVIQVEI